MEELITSFHCVQFGSWNYASLLKSREPLFKLENALLVREQITNRSLQLPQLGVIKKKKKRL